MATTLTTPPVTTTAAPAVATVAAPAAPVKKAAPAIDYDAAVKKYAPDAESAKIKAIVKHLGIALRSKDGASVAASSKDELARVRESWLKKKLGLTLSDAELDAAIKDVATLMKAEKNKSRVAFYYLLAGKFGKLASLG